MSVLTFTVAGMEYLPLTRPDPWTEIPVTGGMEPLFAELGPPGLRPVEVTVTLPEGHCAMYLVVPQAGAAEALGMALGACAGVEEFEITVRRFKG